MPINDLQEIKAKNKNHANIFKNVNKDKKEKKG
jgi:hypothetical protein